jgi:hypothetical protein
MQLQTFSFANRGGWSLDRLPDLDSERTLVVAFGAPGLIDNPAPLATLREAYPHSSVIGCSTSGEIAGSQLADESLSVAVARFDQPSTRVTSASVEVTSQAESFAAGQQLAAKLNGPDLRAVLVYSDGLKVNGSELVRGLSESLPASVVVTGGLAGDGDRFKRTWAIADGAAASGIVCAAGLYGDSLSIGHGFGGGWTTFGPERVITRSEGNVLYELDGKPALQLYKDYLGEYAQGLPATAFYFPLAMRASRDDQQDGVIRTVLGLDEATQSITFAGDMPQGGLARLMRGNIEQLIEGAADAAADASSDAASDTSDSPTLAISVSCVGRRLVLGERTEEEIEAMLSSLPDGTQQVGFYSYGELSPFATGACRLHNQVVALTTVAER